MNEGKELRIIMFVFIRLTYPHYSYSLSFLLLLFSSTYLFCSVLFPFDPVFPLAVSSPFSCSNDMMTMTHPLCPILCVHEVMTRLKLNVPVILYHLPTSHVPISIP